VTWGIYTDGSAICHDTDVVPRRFPGGWAAVVEHGQDGYVIRGREAATTNVRMELVAAIRGLREVPDGDRAVLHFDCTVIYTVRDRWQRNLLDGMRLVSTPHALKDGDLWADLAAEYDRVEVELRKVRGANPIHRRAHAIAQAEAKAEAAGLPAYAVVLSKIERKARRQVDLAQYRQDDLRRRSQVNGFARMATAFERHGLRHLSGCEPGACVVSCPVWLNFGVPVDPW
jgi:ribonuclease HI